MKLESAYKSLCMPSKVYFVLAFMGMALSILMPNMFGGLSATFHILHFIYIFFWTWVLNFICQAGYKWISWVLILSELILILLIVSVGTGGSRESDRALAMKMATQL